MKSWPHAPVHMFNEKCTYMVTAATYQKAHFFKEPSDLDLVNDLLIELAEKYGWRLEAWSIFF